MYIIYTVYVCWCLLHILVLTFGCRGENYDKFWVKSQLQLLCTTIAWPKLHAYSLHQGWVCQTKFLAHFRRTCVSSGDFLWFPMISYDFLVGSNLKSSKMATPRGHNFQAISIAATSGVDPRLWQSLKMIGRKNMDKSSVAKTCKNHLMSLVNPFDVTLVALVQVFPWSQQPWISPSGTWPMEKNGGDLSGCCKGSRTWETLSCEMLWGCVSARCYMDHTWIMMADLNSDSYHDLFLRFPETFRTFRLAVPHKSSDLAPSKVGLQAQRDSGQKLGMHRLWTRLHHLCNLLLDPPWL